MIPRALRDLGEVFNDYRSHGDLLRQFVLRDLRVRYKQAVMGLLWALFMPALFVTVGILARLAFARAGGSGVSPALLGGVALRSILWAGFASTITFGTSSLVGNSALVGKVYFPREVLPVSALLSSGVDTIVALAALTVALPWLGAQVTLALIWVPVLLIIWYAGLLALVLFLSAANLFFRDVKYLVQAVLSVGVLVTPVFYSASEIGGTAGRMLRWNPLTPILDGMSLAVFRGHDLAAPLRDGGVTIWDPATLIAPAVIALAGLVGASLLFHRAEDLFAERV